jgi:hypothetical protein
MGRVRDPELWAEWRERSQRFERGGLTVAAFCGRERVSTGSFYVWRRKLAAESSVPARVVDHRAAEGAPPLFVPVRWSRESAAAGRVEIELPNGALVRVTQADESLVRQVILAAGQVGREDASC